MYNRNEILEIIKKAYISGEKNADTAIYLTEQGYTTKRGIQWSGPNVSMFLKVEDREFFEQHRRIKAYSKTPKEEINEDTYINDIKDSIRDHEAKFTPPEEEPKREVLPEVINKDDKFIVTSLNVAEVFGKEHRDVLRAIYNSEFSDDFRLRHFAQTSYFDSQGKRQPMFELTKNGFSGLVMGFTGKKATQFKEMYINEFDRMEQELKKGHVKQLTPEEIVQQALLIVSDENKQLKIENKKKQDTIEKLEPLAAFANKSLGIISMPLSKFGSILGSRVRDMGKLLIYKFLKKHGYLYQRNKTYEAYAKYSRLGPTQYFVNNLISFDADITDIHGNVVDTNHIDKIQIHITRLGATKILDLLFENAYLDSSEEYMQIHRDIPTWFERYREQNSA